MNLLPTHGLGRPQAGTRLKPVHRENPRKPLFLRYLRGGRTSADGMQTATIITAFTYGLGSIESVASGRVTRTDSLPKGYRARCVPNSLIPSVARKNAVFQPISFAEGPPALSGRLTNSVEAYRQVLFGTAGSGSPVAQVFNLCLSIPAARGYPRPLAGRSSRPSRQSCSAWDFRPGDSEV